MALASQLLNFEIVELWSDEGDGKFHCTYVHADEDLVLKYPEIITGHFPNHKKEHVLSPIVIIFTFVENINLIKKVFFQLAV
jgi:hypothetical protein